MIRLTYREAGVRVTQFGAWATTWEALDWAFERGLLGASARKT